MNELQDIVNFEHYPINNSAFQDKCFNRIRDKSVLILKNFINKKCLNNIQKEALLLEKKAFYCSKKHTVLLKKKNKNISYDDPLNIEVISDKGCVPHDLINADSYLNQLYNSFIFKNFLKKVLGIKYIYPYKDKLSSINYNYYQNSQQLGWHFDNASFAITLMIQSPDNGGVFEYLVKGRDYNKNYIDKDLIKKVLDNKIKSKELFVSPGTLILFYGRNYLHRVTPVTSIKSRILVTLNYNEEKNIELSENARLTFFGRV